VVAIPAYWRNFSNSGKKPAGKRHRRDISAPAPSAKDTIFQYLIGEIGGSGRHGRQGFARPSFVGDFTVSLAATDSTRF
jgi:hypothetical protein